LALSIAIGEPLPLDEIANAHDRVDSGTRDRVVIAVLN
jgi:NADPH:quinone reductase